MSSYDLNRMVTKTISAIHCQTKEWGGETLTDEIRIDFTDGTTVILSAEAEFGGGGDDIPHITHRGMKE